MTDNGHRKTPRQRAAMTRRKDLVLLRLRQRWARGFRQLMIERKRMRLARQHERGLLGVILDKLRMAR